MPKAASIALGASSSVFIADELRSRVRTGLWKPGQKIATEMALAREFKVCRATINKCLKTLEGEGLFYSNQGKGRFVAEPEIRKTWALGLILSDLGLLDHPVVSQKFSGVKDATLESCYSLKIFALNTASNRGHVEGRYRWLGLVDPTDIDGAVVMTDRVQLEGMHELAKHVPVVRMGYASAPEDIPGAHCDFMSGAFQAAQHLLTLGHRRLALLGVASRYAAWREYQHGVRMAVASQAHADSAYWQLFEAQHFSVEEGRRLGQNFLTTSQRPTGVICASDELALGFYQTISEAGLSVPKDVSLVGWNDTLTTSQIPVPMTTIRMDWHQLGVLCTKHLLAMVDHKSNDLPTEIHADLIVRNSTRYLHMEETHQQPLSQ